MPKVKVTVYVSVHSSIRYTGGADELTFWCRDMSSVGYTNVHTQEVEIDVPDDLDPTQNQVKDLHLAQERIRAEAESKVKTLEGVIQSLLSLPAPGVNDVPF